MSARGLVALIASAVVSGVLLLIGFRGAYQAGRDDELREVVRARLDWDY